MPVCTRCHQDVGIVGRLSYNAQTGRCGSCAKQVDAHLNHLRAGFLHYCSDHVFSPAEYHDLTARCAQAGIHWQEFANFVYRDSLAFLERALAYFSADGYLTADQASHLADVIRILGIRPQDADPMRRRLEYLVLLGRVLRGELPTVRAPVHLDADEVCHLHMNAMYEKPTKRPQLVHGDLLASNRRIYFLSPQGGWKIAWKNVRQVERHRDSIYIGLSVRKGNGRYAVPDPTWASTVLHTMVRLQNRHLVQPGSSDSRHIPQHVKVAVWQRDQGRCTQCRAAEYLEFDHIIPFAKGGANSEGNIQLLCRRCNLQKGSSI